MLGTFQDILLQYLLPSQFIHDRSLSAIRALAKTAGLHIGILLIPPEISGATEWTAVVAHSWQLARLKAIAVR